MSVSIIGDFCICPGRHWDPPILLYNGCGVSSPGVKLLAPRLKKKQSYTTTPIWAYMTCYTVNFSFISIMPDDGLLLKPKRVA
jgi:hypothetical protein